MSRRQFFKRIPHLSKRSNLVLSTTVLTIGLLIAFLLGPRVEIQSIGVLSLSSVLLGLYCLRNDLSGKKWLIIILLPLLFTIACGLFYYLLPARWLTRIIMLAIYAIGFYAILLAENIYIISTERSIKLLHAARTIGFLLSVVCAFGLYNVIFSLHTYLPFVVISIFIVSFLLILPTIWSMVLTDFISVRELIHTMVLTVAITEIGTLLTFWPVSVTFAAIFLAGNFYTLVGVSQYWVENRLFKRVLWEFVWVAVVLIIILFFTAKWGG